MLKNINEILNASGSDLLQPVSFGSQTGKTLLEIDESFWYQAAQNFGYSPEQFLSKVKEAKEYADQLKNSNRKVITSISQIREFFYDDQGVQRFLYDKQQKQFILKFGTVSYGGLIASIGAGKTIAMLEMIRLRWKKDKDRAIIFVPKNVIGSFQDAINNYFKGKAKVSIVSGDKESKLKALKKDAHFYISNPETVRQTDCFEALKDLNASWIVCDEAHRYLVNPQLIRQNKDTGKKHKTTVALMMGLSANIEMRFLMTGTPRRKSDLDFYQLVTFMDRGEHFGTSFYKFRSQWFIKSFNGYDYNLNPSLVNKFKAIIEKMFHYVSEEDALKGLPPLIEENIEVELTGEALKAYREMHKESVIDLKEYLEYEKYIKSIPKDERTKEQNEKRQVLASNAGVRILRLRQMSSGFVSWNDYDGNEEIKGIVNFNKDKLHELNIILDNMNEPVIIGAWFKQEIEDIEKLLKKKKLKFATIKGGQSDKKTDNAKKDFISRKLDVIILQIKAGGTGLDGLQKVCSKMILYSRDYAWYEYDQIKGRIKRRGQEKPMVLINLISVLPKRKKTVDHAVMNSIKGKKSAFKEIVGDVIDEN